MMVRQLFGTMLLAVTTAVPVVSAAEPNVDPATVRQHAEQSFNQLKQADAQEPTKLRAASSHKTSDHSGNYSDQQYLIGKGQGDMAKGKIICQRVSELSARTDLAKQIRILVKEHMVDRIRERTGRGAEQDIEVTREEIVQEYLQGVKIVERQIDEEGKTCSATAVMPKNQIQPKQPPDQPEPISTIAR